MMTHESTHWDGCWRMHHECAIKKIEKLQHALRIAIEKRPTLGVPKMGTNVPKMGIVA